MCRPKRLYRIDADVFAVLLCSCSLAEICNSSSLVRWLAWATNKNRVNFASVVKLLTSRLTGDVSAARGVCPNCGALSQLRRSFIEFSGNLKHPVEIRGIRWKSKKSCENAWNSTEIHGKQMEIFGIRWKTMESGGVWCWLPPLGIGCLSAGELRKCQH